VLHIFTNETRGSVLWLDSAKNFEEAKSKAKKFYADQPAEYFNLVVPIPNTGQPGHRPSDVGADLESRITGD
jgi:hypothetical protein